MKQFNKQTGNQGEEIATMYLRANGYKIIERNYHTKFGELDIICQKADVIIFVEVKTKTNLDYGVPEMMINQHKLNQIRQTGEVYVLSHNLNNSPCRIDIITIVLSENQVIPQINHHQNVY